MKTKNTVGKDPRVREQPISYGRQKKNKTQKSVALSKEATQWAQEQADKEGISFSAFVEKLITNAIHTSIWFLAAHLAYHWCTGSANWITDGIAAALTNGTKIALFAGDIISQLISQ
jgi:hypothetical protein